MARPFHIPKNWNTDSISQQLDSSWMSTKMTGKIGKLGKWELLPMRLMSQFNTNHPFGWNRAGFMQAKGLQTQLSGGVYAEWGIFSAQIKPEYTYSANPQYEYGNGYGAAIYNQNIQRIRAGQSSFRLNYKVLSVGISSENLWWGPGIYNSLLMSNNAPGFWHLTFNSRKPLKTPIGDFEWQLIGGKLVEDTSALLEIKNLTTNYYNPQNYGGLGNSGPYDPKQKWRYLSGLTINWHPKWVEGLFIGINRVGYSYIDNIDSSGLPFMKKYFPVLFGAFRQNYPYGNDTASHPVRYKQIVSANFRWLFPKSHFEVYGEYGAHDNTYNLRDLTINVQHASAYTIGFKKLYPLQKTFWLDIGAELTNLAQSTNYLTRLAGYWYQYQGGYTNQNRIIGAGVGSGNNVFTWQTSVMRGYDKIGFSFQQVKFDPVPADPGLPLTTLGLRDFYWKDYVFGIHAQKKYKRFLAYLQIQAASVKNYRWVEGNNTFNLIAFLDVQYRL